MAWVIGAIIVVVVAFLVLKSGTTQTGTVRHNTKDAQSRAKSLPIEEQAKFSADIRELAKEQYDMASETARNAGKPESFSHQVGVLRAVNAVLTLGSQLNASDEAEVQGETIPFNKLGADEGREAVAEYLVFKFFPDQADTSKFEPALKRFKAEMSAASQEEPDPYAFMVTMIYSCRFDWQRYIADMPSEPA